MKRKGCKIRLMKRKPSGPSGMMKSTKLKSTGSASRSRNAAWHSLVFTWRIIIDLSSLEILTCSWKNRECTTRQVTTEHSLRRPSRRGTIWRLCTASRFGGYWRVTRLKLASRCLSTSPPAPWQDDATNSCASQACRTSNALHAVRSRSRSSTKSTRSSFWEKKGRLANCYCTERSSQATRK